MIIIIQPNETKYWGLRQQTQYYRDLILGLRFEKAFYLEIGGICTAIRTTHNLLVKQKTATPDSEDPSDI